MTEENETEQVQEQVIKIEIPDLNKLSIKDGDVLVVQADRMPTDIYKMIEEKFELDLKRVGITAGVLVCDKNLKLSVIAKEISKE